MKRHLEGERKAYDDFQKQVEGYSNNPALPNDLKNIIKAYGTKVGQNKINYESAINHIGGVSLNSMGTLKQKLENIKKEVLLSEKQTEAAKKADSYGKLKDFEYERFMNIKLSLLHYLNAQMLI